MLMLGAQEVEAFKDVAVTGAHILRVLDAASSVLMATAI